MKRIIVGMMMAAFFMASANIVAQDDEITDEDLRKFAILEEVIDLMKKDISTEVNKLIKAQEGMTGARYVELAKARGDESKLAALEAKDFEIKFLELVENLKDERTEAIKTVNQELATKMIGDNGRTYKAIKAQLDDDAEFKARYEAVKAELGS